MKAVEFCYWLQGLFECAEPTALNEKQTDLIRKHLALVFAHEIDPSYGNEKVQKVLDAIHSAPETVPKFPPVAHDHIHPSDVKYRC